MSQPSYQLTEPVVLALAARLRDPGQLNAEIALIAQSLSVEDEAKSLVGVEPAQVFEFVPPPSFLTSFPTVGIQDINSLLEDDTGHSATGKHRIGIVVFCSNPDQRLLAWELRRYVQAITRTVLAERTLGSESPLAAWGTGLQQVHWGPTLESAAAPKTYMSWAMVEIWAKREEL